MAHGPWKKHIRFCWKSNWSYVRVTVRWCTDVLFMGVEDVLLGICLIVKIFATSVALAEVCTLLSAVLVFN